MGLASRIAIIGAGIAGTTAAHRLAEAGAEVTVFEKSRGAGGRTSTRRAPPHAFDHGAQYVTARGEGFRAAVEDWVAAGVAAPWQARLVDLDAGTAVPHPSEHPRYVGVPGMNAICKHLLGDVPLHRAARIVQVERTPDAWRLVDEAGGHRGSFDAVIVTAPPAQAEALLHDAPALAAVAREARMAPCWTWMAAFDEPTGLDFDGAFVMSGGLAWIARDGSKPGRETPGETWVAQASADWTRAHLDLAADDALPLLEAAFREATGHDGRAPSTAMAHRWLHADVERSVGRPFLWDTEHAIGVAGDWLAEARVEGAWTSGRALAEAMVEALALRAPA